MIHIDISDKDIEAQTYGGEYSSSDLNLAYYGLDFGDIKIEVSPKTALALYLVLGEHLKTNGCL